MAKQLVKAYENADKLMEKVEEYFDITEPKFQTRAGLCIHLGITKQTFLNYKNGTQGDEMKEVCEWACTRLENKYEVDLSLRPNPTGPIFALKQYGWRDSQDVDLKSSGFEIVCNVPRPEEK
jgi:hypothetical protein